jgi:predicted MPP superfamily phosphohydrolase
MNKVLKYFNLTGEESNKKISMQIISDVHLEFLDKDQKIQIETYLQPCASYLLILGDLGYPYLDSYREFLEQVSKLYKKVFVVSGNHEYYTCKTKQFYIMDDINDMIINICKKLKNVYFLNNDEYILNDRVVLLGTTLWSAIPEDKKETIRFYMNDYAYIYKIKNNEKMNVTPNDTVKLFDQNITWLKEKLEQYRDKEIVILTHHLPSFKLVHEKYKDNEMNYAFASHLDYIMERYGNIKYWLCGHTHFSMEAKINKTVCMTNPTGYNNENKSYDTNKIFFI